jgi:hypothetical protein
VGSREYEVEIGKREKRREKTGREKTGRENDV